MDMIFLKLDQITNRKKLSKNCLHHSIFFFYFENQDKVAKTTVSFS